MAAIWYSIIDSATKQLLWGGYMVSAPTPGGGETLITGNRSTLFVDDEPASPWYWNSGSGAWQTTAP